MPTIQSIISGPTEPFGEPDDKGARMTGYEIATDDGQTGAVYRKTSSKPLEVGMTVEPSGTTKKGTKKFKVGNPGCSGGSGGGNKGEFRTPDQIIRTSAIEAAVAHFAGANKPESTVIDVAKKFAEWIKGDQAQPVAATPQTDDIPF